MLRTVQECPASARRSRRFRWSLLTALLVVLVLTPTASAAVAQGSSIGRDWPSHAGYSTMDAQLTPLVVGTGAPYFWAHQFGFQDSGGGYIGLQSGGYRHDGTRGKTALFSIWDADDAVGPYSIVCIPFNNEGSGQSCMLPYEWQLGRSYRLTVAFASTGATGAWWSGTVVDEVTGTATRIGEIHVPWKRMLGWSTTTFTEYFGGDLAACSDQPYSKVLWGTMRADGVDAPTVDDYLYQGDNCGNARITDEPDGDVYQEAGVTPAIAPPAVTTVATTTPVATTPVATTTPAVTKVVAPPIAPATSVTTPATTPTPLAAQAKVRAKPKPRCKRVVRRHRSRLTGRAVRRTVLVCPKR
jgi:hypothetical protein